MSRRAFRIAAVTTVLILLLTALNTIRATGRQSTMPRPLDAKDPITYFIADGNGQTGYRSSDRELALWALEAWRRGAEKSFRLAAAPESRALDHTGFPRCYVLLRVRRRHCRVLRPLSCATPLQERHCGRLWPVRR